MICDVEHHEAMAA